jgi:hypothetical protein
MLIAGIEAAGIETAGDASGLWAKTGTIAAIARAAVRAATLVMERRRSRMHGPPAG